MPLAAAFHHDLNENGRMDHAWATIPTEPWGVSGDAPLRPLRPRFDDAAFVHPGGRQMLRVR